MDIKSLVTIGELPTVESTNPEQEFLVVQTPEKTGKMPLSNLPSEASKIGFDNKGTNLSSNTVQAAITELNSSLNGKVGGFASDTYEAVTGLAYDPTNKKLGLKVGADTVIPFSGDDFNEVLSKTHFPVGGSNQRSDATYYEFNIGNNASMIYCWDSDNINKTQVLYKIGQTVHVSGAAENDFTWTSKNIITLKRSSTLGNAYINVFPCL